MSSAPALSRHHRLSEHDQRWAQRLIFSGWTVALLYFPSGLLHLYLGGKVYARDGLMGLHFAVSVWFLFRTGLVGRWLKHCWWLALVPLLVLPAAADRASVIEVFTVWKWVVLWNDWIILGMLAALTSLNLRGVTILGVLTAILLLADAAAGFREYQTNQFFLPIKSGEKSALGVALGVNEVLGGKQIRLNGLQRDVFFLCQSHGPLRPWVAWPPPVSPGRSCGGAWAGCVPFYSAPCFICREGGRRFLAWRRRR